MQCVPIGVPQYNYVQIGLTPETIEKLDEMADSDDYEFDSRSEGVRKAVREML